MGNSARLEEILGEKIGFVLSNANAISIPFALFSGGPEVRIREENLAVIIDERASDIAILGVIRRIRRLEPFLRQYQRVSIIDFPHMYEDVEKLPYTNAEIIPLAELKIENGEIKSLSNTVTYIPFPGSKVHLLKKGKILSVLLESFLEGEKPLVIGEHKYTPGLEIPLNPKFLRYHVGVFGATGMGKSRLIKALVDEIVQKTDYSVIIFDHTGMDFAPFYPRSTIYSTEIKLDPITAANWLVSKTRVSENVAQYIEGAFLKLFSELEDGESNDAIIREMIDIMNDYSKAEDEVSREELADLFYQKLLNLIPRIAKQMGAKYADVQLKTRMELFVKPFEVANVLLRSLSPDDVIDYAREFKRTMNAPLVIDLSLEDTIEAKRAIIASIIRAVWNRVIEAVQKSKNGGGGNLEQKIIFVIDEAQNYAYRARYCEEQVEKIAREGRKWAIGLIIASQRLANSVSTDIRANINTIFFSRLNQTTDLDEISKFADISGVTLQSLAQLDQREFFVAGLMNPFRKPIVIRVKEVKAPGEY